MASLISASPTAMRPHLLSKRHCATPGWDSTNITNWNDAQTNQWFDAWWKFHLGGNGPDTSTVIPHGWPNDFANLFGRMYLRKENFECAKVDDQCYGDVACDDIQYFEHWGPECDSKESARPIYLIMTSLQTFQDYFKDFTRVLDETQVNFLGMSAYLTSNFFPKPSSASTLFLKEFFSALGTVFSISASGAKLIPLIAGSVVGKEATGAAGALLGAVGNGFATTVSFPADPSFQNLANLNQFMTNVFESARSNMQNMQATIAPGKLWQGKGFRDIVKGGAFLPGRANTQFNPGTAEATDVTLRKYMAKQFNARTINTSGARRKSSSPTLPMSMEVASKTNKARKMWHQKSVGAGTTLNLDSFDTGKMDHPTGWDKLNAVWIDQGYNLALNDVFESSIAAWQAEGFGYDGQKSIDRAQSALTDNWANPMEQDTKWEGTFTIPVCNTGDLSYNVQMGDRIMPCNCGGDGSQASGFKKNSDMEDVYDQQCTADKQAARQQSRYSGKGNLPTNIPSLPTDVNKIACLGGDGPTADMVASITSCQQAIASLGNDDSKQICSNNCADGGHSFASNYCRVALDNSQIHNCALILAAKDQEHGGPGSTCVSVGDAKKFLVNAQATVDNGGSGCHKVGTIDMAATFMTPDGMSRWRLSSYDHPDWCTV